MNHPILRINEHTVSVGKSKRSIAKIVFKKILDRAYKQSLSWLDQIFRFVVCIMCILVGEGGGGRGRGCVVVVLGILLGPMWVRVQNTAEELSRLAAAQQF